MYRVFCESYETFLKTLDDNSYRKQIAKPLELIVNTKKFQEEKKKQSELYQKVCDLISFMEKNIVRFPKLKAFLWTLSSRNILGESYNISTDEELEEQTKLVNSFLKLAYWY